MELNYIKITTSRPFNTIVRIDGEKVNHRGMEAIGRTPSGAKKKYVSTMLFTLPLEDDEKQTEALVKDVYEQILLEEKKLELFYKNINDMKLSNINPLKSRR